MEISVSHSRMVAASVLKCRSSFRFIFIFYQQSTHCYIMTPASCCKKSDELKQNKYESKNVVTHCNKLAGRTPPAS